MRSVQSVTDREIQAFRRKILTFYKKHRRDLPWRNTTDPYRVTVAEIMLQQTQVERVMPKYEEWVERWQNWRSLAGASNEQVLRAWSGLGYNRRAIFLKGLAEAVMERHKGVLPHNPELLEQLPGIGPYTSRAILIFAFNKPLATVDTNIRKVLLHSFGLSPSLSATAILEFATRVVPVKRARDWHNALMDYSRLMLPKQIANIPPVARQSRFQGSARQVRGEIVRQLVQGRKVTVRSICRDVGRDISTVEKIADRLAADGLIRRQGTRLLLP